MVNLKTRSVHKPTLHFMHLDFVAVHLLLAAHTHNATNVIPYNWPVFGVLYFKHVTLLASGIHLLFGLH